MSVSRPSAPVPLRPLIAASWARSARSGVRPDRLDPAAADDVAVGGRLSTLATPVLDRLGRHLDETRATLVLTDARARVLDRRAGMTGLADVLDEVGLVPGHSYAEDAVGTNGMGTAAEERRPVTVVGEEHYAESLRGLTCVGVPVVHPVTGRLEGIVDLTCFNDDAGRWMTPLAMEVAHAVEMQLAGSATRTEQALLAAFVARSRRTSTPIVAVTADIVLTNPAAARLLAPQDHQQLWEVVSGLGTTELAAEVALADGSSVQARFEPVEVGRLTAGAVIALDRIGNEAPVPHRRRRSTARVEPAAAGGPAFHGGTMHGDAMERGPVDQPSAVGTVGAVGASPAWRRAARELAQAVAAGTTAVLRGPSGAGKLTLARAQLPDAVVLDATRAVIDGPQAWLQQAAAHLAGAEPIVARRVDLLDAATAMGLATLLQGAPDAIVVATAVDGAGEPGLLHGFGAVVAVPGLEARLDDLPALARALVGRMLPSETPAIAPEALQALARAEWPGQVRQLEQVLRHALAQRTRDRILLDDLPTAVRAVAHRRRLTPREQRDCQAITAALADAEGNKVLAAELLGMSRSTLYRKMSAFGLDLDRRAY
ncbi:MAG TPA: helix-turn-helix domain-containing protein [Iamia sp.]|nr:helix-turn-helix domain-containing protein [Iamia sp.]